MQDTHVRCVMDKRAVRDGLETSNQWLLKPTDRSAKCVRENLARTDQADAAYTGAIHLFSLLLPRLMIV